jgi:hypothetical protein
MAGNRSMRQYSLVSFARTAAEADLSPNGSFLSTERRTWLLSSLKKATSPDARCIRALLSLEASNSSHVRSMQGPSA